MICTDYEQKTVPEKIIFTGKLLHAVMNDDRLHKIAEDIIKIAEAKGLFEGVTILPDNFSNQDTIHNAILPTVQ